MQEERTGEGDRRKTGVERSREWDQEKKESVRESKRERERNREGLKCSELKTDKGMVLKLFLILFCIFVFFLESKRKRKPKASVCVCVCDPWVVADGRRFTLRSAAASRGEAVD